MYRPSHRPSFRLRMFPSPFARLFGIKSASFVTANHTVNSRGKLSKTGTVIKKLSIALRAVPPYLCLLRRNFCAAGGVLLWFQRCDFRTDEKPFPLTTAVQNMHVLLRKLPLLKEHFFEWLKTANFSTACETATLKSPPPRAFSVPHVHL